MFKLLETYSRCSVQPAAVHYLYCYWLSVTLQTRGTCCMSPVCCVLNQKIVIRIFRSTFKTSPQCQFNRSVKLTNLSSIQCQVRRKTPKRKRRLIVRTGSAYCTCARVTGVTVEPGNHSQTWSSFFDNRSR